MNDRAAYANANAALLPLADKSVHMIATSPPYWGLRDYGTAKWEGGDPECQHRVGNQVQDTKAPGAIQSGMRPGVDASTCNRCGATRIDNQLGLERVHDCLAWARGDDPCGACYVCNLRTWAREMWRVLRDDGVMFLNLGDSYASSGKAGPVSDKATWHGGGDYDVIPLGRAPTPPGLKHKDLCGIPWRVALALQADGWYLRSDIVWAKPNPMPESVTDRPTKAHEYIFLLTKSARYFWDAEGVREPHQWQSPEILANNAQARQQKRLVEKGNFRTQEEYNQAIRGERAKGRNTTDHKSEMALKMSSSGRNLRTVWTIATAPYAGAHYATWPPALVERMVKAGSSERGVCPTCGAPWRRVVEKSEPVNAPRNPNDVQPYPAGSGYNNGAGATTLHKVRHVETVEWRPTCGHADAAPVPAIVLDPFAGSGTTLLVARNLGRVGLGFDLSETYLRQNAAVRLGHDRLAAWGRGVRDDNDYSDLFRTNGNGATE